MQKIVILIYIYNIDDSVKVFDFESYSRLISSVQITAK